MNKSLSVKLFALLVMSSLITLSVNNAQATTYHTVSDIADGVIGDFDADEFMDEDNGIHHNFTYMEPTGHPSEGLQWQFSPLSVASGDAMGNDLFIFWAVNETDETNGCDFTSDWNSVSHTLPFFAQYGLYIEDSGYHKVEACSNNATGWSVVTDNLVAFMGDSGTPVTEFKLPYNDVGTFVYAGGADLSYMAYTTWQNANNVYASWPTQNPANQAGAEEFTHFYKMPIESGYSPLMAPTCPEECLDPDPPATPGGGNATVDVSSLTDSIAVVIQISVVVIMVRVVMDMVRKLR